MPRGNGMGPNWAGPMTGRGAGYCAGFGAPGYANAGAGYGMGFGRGRGFYGGGRGRRNWYYATGVPGWMRSGGWAPPFQAPGPDAERQTLKNQAVVLQEELDLVKKRLSDLEAQAGGQ